VREHEMAAATAAIIKMIPFILQMRMNIRQSCSILLA